MKKIILTFTISLGLYFIGYSQEQPLDQMDILGNSTEELQFTENSISTSLEIIALAEDNDQETEGQNSPQQGEKGEIEEESLQSNPLRLDNEEEVGKSLRTESSDYPLPEVPEGSQEQFASEPEINKKEEVKDEDSVLSFNFLYLLIQKFKLSEIME